MNQRFSVYLDLLRFLAALVVFVSHFAYPRFTEGDYIIFRELNLGSDAVVFFFVLSGLVIAYTTEVKDKTFKQYIFNRSTRLYSVVLPALILTVVLDLLGQHVAPQNYNGWWYHGAPIWEQLLRGLSFTNQWAGQDFRIGTNGPYWSLSYEAAYYILFGVAFYISGLKRHLILLPLIILFGFSVMFLFPAWLVGVWGYKQIKNKTLPLAYAWPCTILPLLIYPALLWMNIPDTLLLITAGIFGVEFVNETLSFSDEFIWNIIIAQLIAFHLIGIAMLFDKKKAPVSKKLKAIICWCAGATFTIYVVHYPALQFMDAVLPDIWPSLMRHIVLFSSVLLLCFVFAEISERRLKWFRHVLSYRK